MGSMVAFLLHHGGVAREKGVRCRCVTTSTGKEGMKTTGIKGGWRAERTPCRVTYDWLAGEPRGSGVTLEKGRVPRGLLLSAWNFRGSSW